MDTAQTFKLSAARQAVMKDYSLLPLGPGQLEHTKAHEAGFDAMATAQTFALELEKYVAPGGAIPAAWTADEHVTEVAFVLDREGGVLLSSSVRIARSIGHAITELGLRSRF
ncbi:MAG: uncharacterized protein KVP18_001004 [Porospora cf. gigantea A]|uniref:uncharacterized protein n=1 Tax=Porospora cf. gigantea A TaxID=2853593 RepID=UPI003559772C|nr:MAG: hypothetical protein KVP18_001004 [Porospora cf. gigantea A]